MACETLCDEEFIQVQARRAAYVLSTNPVSGRQPVGHDPVAY